MFVIGLLVGLEIFGILQSIVTTIISKMSGMFLMSVGIFSIRGTRTYETEKLKWSRKAQFSITPVVTYGKVSVTAEELRKTTITIESFLGLIVMIYSVFVCSQFWGVRNSSSTFFMSTAFMMIICLIAHARSFIKNFNKENLGLINRYADILDQLRNGATYEQIQVPVIDNNSKCSGSLKCAFLTLSYNKAFVLKDYANLGKITRMIDTELRTMGKGSYTTEPTCIGFYYLIIFYSTYINPNYANAIRFYNIVKRDLEADTNTDGLIVKAYYQFYIMKRPEMAAITISKAEQALDDRVNPNLVPAEIDMERKLIEELRNNMTRVISPDYGYKPIISPDYD
ncbi:MAG: hypothetical protein IKS48_08945 [Eubacterium sp.]|nr:hypothetical protein [Eubacterium sp.]